VYAYAKSSPFMLIDPSGLDGIPTPGPEIPGGPWTPNDANRPGSFLGPKSPEGGGRGQLQWVPPEGQGGPPGSGGYWKTQKPGEGWGQRFDRNGKPITPEQAHPGPGFKLPTPRSPWLLMPNPCRIMPQLCWPNEALICPIPTPELGDSPLKLSGYW
jgi:hypothetical protein